MEPEFSIYILKSILSFNFKIFTISCIDTIRVCGTILMLPSQRIFSTMFECQFHMLIVKINVNKVIVPFNFKNPS